MSSTPTAPDPAETSPMYSSFWRRVAAAVVDNLILLVPAILLGQYAYGIGAIFLVILYGAYFESSPRRATWGKQACGLQVETVGGERLALGVALVRQFLKLLGNALLVITWIVFFVPAAFTKRRQGLHDLAVSTVVRRIPGKGMPGWLVGIIAATLPASFVIGALAAITIPAFQDYTIRRTKIMDGLAAGQILKTAISEHFALQGKLPVNASELGDASTIRVKEASATYRNGRVEIHMQIQEKAGTIYITPVPAGTELSWKCTAENIRTVLLPVTCRP